MKINQIVSEHKKGVKARGYTKKGPEARKVPKQNSAGNIPTAFAEGDDPLQNRADYAAKHGQGQVYKPGYKGDKVGMSKSYAYDIKRTGPKGQLPKEDMEVGEDVAPQVYKVTKSDPNTGLTLSKPDGTQLILPPDKMNAIAANPNDPNKYLLNPDAVAQQATSGQPSGPEIGREVEVNTAENNPNPDQSAFEDQDEQGDVGGDATDSYIDGVVDHDFEKAQGRLRELAGIAPAAGEAPAPVAGTTPDTSIDNPAVTLDSADGFKDAIKKGLGQAGAEHPETMQKLDQLIASEPDGSVDIKQSFTNIAKEFGDALPQLAQMMRDLLAAMKQGINSPEFKEKVDAETQQSVFDSITELERLVPSLEQQVANYKAQLQQTQAASPRPAAGVQEAKELEAMLRIAGLR